MSTRDFVQRRMAARREQQEAGLGGWFGAFVDGEMLCGLGLVTDGVGAWAVPERRDPCHGSTEIQIQLARPRQEP